MRRALFFPSYQGGGFGHISRCLALAEALEGQGWETAFAMGGPHLERVHGDRNRQVFSLRFPGSKRWGQGRLRGGAAPVFTVLGDLNYQVVRDGLDSPGAIRAAVREGMVAVRSFHPEVLVADTWLPAQALAHLTGLPLVQIVRSILHPKGAGLWWWRERPQGLVSPDPRPAWNPLLERWGLPSIHKAEDLLDGDLVLVPSFPELDPLPEDAHFCYTGPLVRSTPVSLPDWLEKVNPNQPVVYATAGGGAEGVGGPVFIQAMIDALKGLGVQAIISTGSKINMQDLSQPPSNVRLIPWAPGPATIARSHLVVFSGGYGTTMEAVQSGTPGLVIPFHTEQESNARRLEAADAAEVLLPYEGESYEIWRNGRAGRYSVQVFLQNCLTPIKLRERIVAALENRGLQDGMQRLKAQAAQFGGQQQAAGYIEELLQNRPVTRTGGIDGLSWWEKLTMRAS